MGEFDLNLSTRPFPAYRATNLLLSSILIVLAVVSLWQVVGFFRFTSLAGSIRDEEQNTRVESEALGQRLADLQARLDRPEAAAKLNEIGFLNSLIVRRNLSWTRVFASLEDIVPESVHLLSLVPSVEAGGSVRMQINLRGRSIVEVSRFIDALEDSPEFAEVIVTTEAKVDPAAGEVNVALSVKYFPENLSQ